jgi:gliding motility-associated lipoprotein GldH
MKMKKSLLYFLLLPALSLLSCSGGKIYEDHKDIERNIWNRFEVVEFDVGIEDTSPGYDFYIAIRHMEQIPLKFITLDFTFYAPSGETRSSELRINLKDSEGNLLGKGMGDLWDVVTLVREDYRFTEPGICRVEISSTMSYADLPGIMNVGLIVRKTD